MQSPDLIFEPIKTQCPQCRETVEFSFEAVQYDDEVTCASCGKVFTLNVNPQRLLEMMKAMEAYLSKKSSGVE